MGAGDGGGSAFRPGSAGASHGAVAASAGPVTDSRAPADAAHRGP